MLKLLFVLLYTLEGLMLKLNSSILVICCKQTTDWKSAWCWERLRAEGEEGVRGWDGWMTPPMQWTWTWANFGSWWGVERPGVLQSMGSQRVRHNRATEQQNRILYKFFKFLVEKKMEQRRFNETNKRWERRKNNTRRQFIKKMVEFT